MGCEYFSTTTYTPKQIKQAAQWSEEDQLPGFETCQELAEEERFVCFKSTISAAVNDALYTEELIANQNLDQEIVLLINIDKAGQISLEEMENASTVLDALPQLSSVVENAIAGLPTALAATKTNVGVKVDAQIKLPIRITASAQ